MRNRRINEIIKRLICLYLHSHGGSFTYKNMLVCSYKTNLSGDMVFISSDKADEPISETLKKWEGYY